MTDLGVSCALFPQPPPGSFLGTPGPYKTSLSLFYFPPENQLLPNTVQRPPPPSEHKLYSICSRVPSAEGKAMRVIYAY